MPSKDLQVLAQERKRSNWEEIYGVTTRREKKLVGVTRESVSLHGLVKTNISNVRRFLKIDVVQRSLRCSLINWKYWLSFLLFRIVWHLPFFISCSYSTDNEWMTSFKTRLVYFALQIIVLGSRMLAKRKGKMKAKLSVLIVSQVRVWVEDKPPIIDFQRPNLTVGIFVFDAECCKWSQGLPGVRSQTTNLRAE